MAKVIDTKIVLKLIDQNGVCISETSFSNHTEAFGAFMQGKECGYTPRIQEVITWDVNPTAGEKYANHMEMVDEIQRADKNYQGGKSC